MQIIDHPTYTGMPCGNETEATECYGDFCTMKNLPPGTKVSKLEAKANGTKWPNGLPDVPGLPDSAPYDDAEIGVAILPDGAESLVVLDPKEPAVNEMSIMCKLGKFLLFKLLKP